MNNFFLKFYTLRLIAWFGFLAAATGQYSALPIAVQKSLNLIENDSMQIMLLIDSAYDGTKIHRPLFAEAALDLATRVNNPKCLAKVYTWYGNSAHNNGKLEEALRWHEKALHLRDSARLTEEAIGSCNNIGTNLKNQEYYKDALSYYRKGLKYVPKNTLSENITSIHNNMGATFRYLSEPDSAYFYLICGLKGSYQLGNQNNVAKAQLNIGVFLQEDRQQYYAAKDSLEKAIKYFREKGDSKYVSKCLLNLGSNYLLRGSVDSALHLYRELIQPENGLIKSDSALALKNIGQALLAKGSYDSALPYLEKAKALFIEMNQSLQIQAVHISIQQCAYGKLQRQRLFLIWGISCALLLALIGLALFRLQRQKRLLAENSLEITRKTEMIALQNTRLAEQKAELAEQRAKAAEQEKADIIKDI